MTLFRAKATPRFKVRSWKKMFHANENDKKVGVANTHIRQNRL